MGVGLPLLGRWEIRRLAKDEVPPLGTRALLANWMREEDGAQPLIELGHEARQTPRLDQVRETRAPPVAAIAVLHVQPSCHGGSMMGTEGRLVGGMVGETGSKTSVLSLNPPPAKEAGEIIEDEDTNETVEKIVAWLDERKLI